MRRMWFFVLSVMKGVLEALILCINLARVGLVLHPFVTGVLDEFETLQWRADLAVKRLTV